MVLLGLVDCATLDRPNALWKGVARVNKSPARSHTSAEMDGSF